MNEEEKNAVGLLKALNNIEKKCKIEKVPYKSEIKKIMISLLPEDYGIFEIILNLIEKLQKENEEFKKENSMIRKVDKIVENITITDIENAIEEAEQQYISVQKVKDKIEELNKKIENEENEKVIVWLHKQRRVLQELIEGRK